jgi:hypothetical protein
MTTIDKTNGIALATSGNASLAIPLHTEGGVRVAREELPERIFLSGKDCFLPDVLVSTTRKEIEDMVNTTSKADAKIIFPRVWNAIKKIDTDAVYRRGGADWNNLMNDVLIYYVCRYRLFGTPMPMVVDDRLLNVEDKGQIDLN